MPTTLASLSEVLSALSRALDLAEGQPPGHSIRACLIGMRLADEMGLDADTRSELYYALLLKDVGGSANAAPMAALFGSDDRLVKRALKLTDGSGYIAAAAQRIRNAAIGAPVWKRTVRLLKVGSAGSHAERELARIRSEAGSALARRLGLAEATAAGIRSLDEHWDGKGHPEGLKGEAIPLLSRIALLARTAELFHQQGGLEAAKAVARSRRGSWFQPELVDCFLAWADDRSWWDGPLAAADALIGSLEPPDRMRTIAEGELDRVAETFAEVVDAKSPYTQRHSTNVAEYARLLAAAVGCDGAECRRLYRAGLLHDIGKLGVSNLILDKTDTLTAEEVAEVRRHVVRTREILARVSAFEGFARTAALHHERLDGSGYAWGLRAEELGLGERILAVADVYEALTAGRSYREALAPPWALAIMRREAGAQLDPDLVEALARLVPAAPETDDELRPEVRDTMQSRPDWQTAGPP